MMNFLDQRRNEMRITTRISLLAAVGLALGSCAGMQSQQGGMSFFVTSAGSGKGADLGGMTGADQICQSLAKAAVKAREARRAVGWAQARPRSD